MTHIIDMTKLILKNYYFFKKIFGNKLKKFNKSNCEYNDFSHTASFVFEDGYMPFFEFQISFKSENIFCLRFNFGNYDHLNNCFSSASKSNTIENFNKTKYLSFLNFFIKQYNEKIKPRLI